MNDYGIGNEFCRTKIFAGVYFDTDFRSTLCLDHPADTRKRRTQLRDTCTPRSFKPRWYDINERQGSCFLSCLIMAAMAIRSMIENLPTEGSAVIGMENSAGRI